MRSLFRVNHDRQVLLDAHTRPIIWDRVQHMAADLEYGAAAGPLAPISVL